MMESKRFCVVALALAVVLAAAVAGRPASGQEPERVMRYFALVVVPGPEWPDPPTLENIVQLYCPDLVSPASKLLVVLPERNAASGSTLEFMSSSARLSGEPAEAVEPCGDGNSYSPGEKWFNAREVTLASSNGSQTFYLLWKDGPPPGGAVAFTGPVVEGGQAYFFDWFWVRAGNSADTYNSYCDPYSNREFAYKADGRQAAMLWIIGKGWFSK